MPQQRSDRNLLGAETYTPKLLHSFLLDMESTERSVQVWERLVELGRSVGLPFIDFIAASSYSDWRRTQFIRTSYDSTWLNELNKEPDIQKWSYFRSHALHHLTPIVIGEEFIEDYHDLPQRRRDVLRMAAERGIRAGLSVPLRLHAPPQAALITYSGDHSRADMMAILQEHGWTLNVAAMVAHQRYMTHFTDEFYERNEITEKQRELLQMVGRGLQDKQIAAELGISISALRQRMHSLMVKAELRNRAEIAALAMCTGLLPDPQFDPDTIDFLIEMDGAGTRMQSLSAQTTPPKK